jgi:F-box protein 8
VPIFCVVQLVVKMGLVLDKLKQIELTGYTTATDTSTNNNQTNNNTKNLTNKPKQSSAPLDNKPTYEVSTVVFPDLQTIPPELSLQILKYLNATDLCLAACVWSSLANDDLLWQGLCKNTWGYATIYNQKQIKRNTDMTEMKSYRFIFMHLDEATLTFNADWKKGLEYLIQQNLVKDDPIEIAKFINSTKKLNSEQKEKLFKEKRNVLENLIILHNYENQFLPTALRRFFSKIEAPKERNSYLVSLLEKFSKRFCSCNPNLDLTEDAVYILCFSLILLSVDLTSPAVKNKMSKREFIRNTRNALPNVNADFTGHLYDNIYLNGNIAAASPFDQDVISVR